MVWPVMEPVGTAAVQRCREGVMPYGSIRREAPRRVGRGEVLLLTLLREELCPRVIREAMRFLKKKKK